MHSWTQNPSKSIPVVTSTHLVYTVRHTELSPSSYITFKPLFCSVAYCSEYEIALTRSVNQGMEKFDLCPKIPLREGIAGQLLCFNGFRRYLCSKRLHTANPVLEMDL